MLTSHSSLSADSIIGTDVIDGFLHVPAISIEASVCGLRKATHGGLLHEKDTFSF